MNNLKNMLLNLLILITISVSYSQCIVDVPSSNGYNVHIELDEYVLNTPVPCASGFEFNITLDYDISYSGSNIPGGLWTLQGVFECTDDNSFFDLSNNQGTGSSTSANTWRSESDCGTSTVSNLGCTDDIILEIYGPGIPSQFVTCSKPLPIKLLDLWLINTTYETTIKWITLNEINNSHFIIEKSHDLINWDSITYIEGNGTVYENTSYEFSYNESDNDIYYRLVQYDFDGKSEISKIIYSTKVNTINVYPTEFNRYLTIENSNTNNISICNSLGQELTHMVSYYVNNTNISIDFKDIQNGIYYIKINDKSFKVIKK